MSLSAMRSADAYVGKSFKYLAITDKSLKKFVTTLRPEDGSLTVDYLVDILTPSNADEIPTRVVPMEMTDNLLQKTLEKAKERVVTLVGILQANYWDELTLVCSERKKWCAVSLCAHFLVRGDRISRIIHSILTELYVQLTVLRTAEDGADMSIRYESSLSY
jgi:hypothetical protein